MSEMGNLYIISAPSGTGKTTLVKALIESVPGITVSISHTTRPQRPGEIHGVNYYFIDVAEFNRMSGHHDFLEHAEIFDNYYGTSKKWVTDTLKSGQDVILEIDWQGCQQILRLFPDTITIFILPPSVNDLLQRLTNRNQDKPEIIKRRISDVSETVSHIHEYDYAIINDDFDAALADLKTIVQAGRLLQRRQSPKLVKLVSELTTAKLDDTTP